MAARLLLRFFRLGLSLLTRQKVEGLENVPDPPYILAINHLGMFDVPFVYSLVGQDGVTGWAAEKYEYHPIFGTLLRAGDAIFIQRGKVDRQALEAAVQVIRNGRPFGMAPEGTRSATQALDRGKTGIAYLAHEADVPVIPAGLTGTERVGWSFLRLRRPELKARFGKPFRLPPLPEKNRASGLRRNTDEVMCRIAALLPPAYRGVYADHPRTRELLNLGYPAVEPLAEAA